MFDAKSLFDLLVRGAAPQQAQRAQGGGLEDILGQILGQLGNQARPSPGGLDGLGDLLRNMVPSADSPAPGGPPGASPGSGLGDILGRIQEQLGGTAGQPSGQGPAGSLIDILGQVLGQATGGVKEGAQRIDDATGASGYARDAIGRASGRTPEDILGQLKDLIEQNKVGAAIGAGGLGAVLLGTRTGRAITGKAVKLGGLALVAGLAYKALQNYQAGRPLIAGSAPDRLTEAPQGSGFETAAISNEAATVYIRGMIAAAAADGRVDAAEQQRLLGGLRQAGLDAGAEEFLAAELNNPATVDSLVAGVRSEQEAVQLFTAARVAIDLDTQEEHDFLVALAQGLGLDGSLVAHVDAEARAAA